MLLEVFTQRNFVADFIWRKLTFIQKTKKSFLSHPFGTSGQRMHSIYSSLESQWSTSYSSQLNIFAIFSVREEIANCLRRYKRKPVEVCVFRTVWATLSANFKRKGRRPPTTVSVRTSDCPFVWYQHIRSVLFHFVTKHACDRHTDRRTDRQKTELRQLIPR